MQVNARRFGATYVFTGEQAKKAAQYVKRQWDAEGRKGSDVTPITYQRRDAFLLSTKTRRLFRKWNYAEWFAIVEALKRFAPKERQWGPLNRFLHSLLYKPRNKQGYHVVNVPGTRATVKA